MSRRSHNRPDAGLPMRAALFAALGDKTRLMLVERLSSGQAASISQLSAGSRITRQAITKHLRVLERAGFVRYIRAGRETRFKLIRRPFEEMEEYLGLVSQQWDRALARLKAFVEDSHSS